MSHYYNDDNDEESWSQNSALNHYPIVGYQKIATPQQRDQQRRQPQPVLQPVDLDNDNETMEDNDSDEEEGSSFLHAAVNHYTLGSYQAAVASFELWRKEQSRSSSDEHIDLFSLSVAADQALSRFRAANDDAQFMFQQHVLYREAIVANEKYVSSIQQLRRDDLIEAALLASISAIWIHTQMSNLRMARYKAWDVLQWSIFLLSPASAMCNTQDALVILSLALSSRSLALRKFRHVLTILDLIEEKDVSTIIERNNAQASRSSTDDAQLCNQEEAVAILARHKLGIKSSAASATNGGIAFKVSVLMQAASELSQPTPNRERIAADLAKVCDASNPSDINLLGCFEAEHDRQQGFNTFIKALARLRDNDSGVCKELTTNLADCLSRSGEHEQAKQLFRFSHQPTLSASPMKNAILVGESAPVSCYEMLWREFISSSLDNDPVATLAATDRLDNLQKSEATALAHVFGQSQADRPSLAKIQTSQLSGAHAYLVLTDEECLPNDTSDNFLKDGPSIATCRHNNSGVAYARAGNTELASTLLLASKRYSRESGDSYLHPHHNLVVLYLQTGQQSKAVDLWEKARRLGTSSQAGLRRKFDSAVEKLDQCREAGVLSRKAWTAKGIGGLLSSRVYLLDCFVLRYRLQEMADDALKKLVTP